jgi:3D (Asp-Asp-Asp) domain-containing protein
MRRTPARWLPVSAALAASLLVACAHAPGWPWRGREQSLVVSATAYNSTPTQTEGNPRVAAWGDRLEPGMRAIAVSPDLLALGLRRGTLVAIDGLPGRYRVLDRMPTRWRRTIDIYMGEDVSAARRWGRRPVTIRWVP